MDVLILCKNWTVWYFNVLVVGETKATLLCLNTTDGFARVCCFLRV